MLIERKAPLPASALDIGARSVHESLFSLMTDSRMTRPPAALTSLADEFADMDDDRFAALLDALGDDRLESRVALLFLHAASADGELSREEISVIADYLDEVLDALGSRQSAESLIQKMLPELGNHALLSEGVAILGAHFSRGALSDIFAKLREAVSADGLAPAEKVVLDALALSWKL